MSSHPFELVPYPDTEIPEVRITGKIDRVGNILTVYYSLCGKVDQVLLPPPNPQPGRKEKLWLETCFEFFLALPNQSQYWEFNFSPSSDWNAFHMDAYRRIGFREEDLIRNPCLVVRREINCLKLEAVIDLSPILELETGLFAGVTSVIQSNQGQETYWALTHPQQVADFHLRDSFILTL